MAIDDTRARGLLQSIMDGVTATREDLAVKTVRHDDDMATLVELLQIVDDAMWDVSHFLNDVRDGE